MQTIGEKIRSLRVDRRNILIESLLFILIYAILLFVLPQNTPVKALVEHLSIVTTSLSAAVLIFLSLSALSTSTRPAWFMLSLALLAWAIADFARFLYFWTDLPFLLFAPDGINLAAYLFAAFGLLRYPSQSRYVPTSFRLILDAVISSGVIATLGWLMLVRPMLGAPGAQLAGVLAAFYPIADLILLTLLFSISLSTLMPRITAIFLGLGLAAFLIADYFYFSMSLFSFGPYGLTGLGWLVAPLLIGIGAVFEKSGQGKPVVSIRQTDSGLSAQFQKVLPVALVLVLFWYVLMGWRFRGNFSTVGIWMSLILGFMLVVRMGIRAGEAELNNYWQLFKNLGDPAFICDTDGNIVLNNPAFQRLENPGAGLRTLGSVFSDLPDYALDDIAENQSANVYEVSVSIKQRKIPFLLSLNSITTESRKILIAGVAHNLSEQIQQRRTIQSAYDELQAVHRQLEEFNTSLERKVVERTANLMEAYRKLEEQNKVLQGLDQLKSDFVSMVSHELRNPLNNLGGGLELLLARPKNRQAEQATLTLMQAEVNRLTRFVESILDVSAIEAGRLDLHIGPVSLVPILEQLVQSFGMPLEAERIQVEYQSDLPDVMAAQTALESVLRHLVDNALKYAPDGPVIVSASQEDGRVCLRVRDFGPGIPEEKKNLLFERFQRLDARDSQSVYGYGLGLYLSRRLLNEMDSTLIYEAPVGGGAQFSFSLPVATT